MGVGFFTILRLFMSLMYLLQSSVDGWTTVGWQALLISAEAADCTQAALDWAHCCTFGVKTLLAADCIRIDRPGTAIAGSARLKSCTLLLLQKQCITQIAATG